MAEKDTAAAAEKQRGRVKTAAADIAAALFFSRGGSVLLGHRKLQMCIIIMILQLLYNSTLLSLIFIMTFAFTR